MGKTESGGKTTAIIGYFTIVGCFIAITMNLEPKNPFARFHIRQAFGMHVLFHAAAIVLTFTGIVYPSTLLYFAYVILLGFGLFHVSKGKQKPLPFLGGYFQQWFRFIQ